MPSTKTLITIFAFQAALIFAYHNASAVRKVFA